jgi:guanosine-3',5'-bis(diphosphate) 3'-pyrophosphohydrolase
VKSRKTAGDSGKRIAGYSAASKDEIETRSNGILLLLRAVDFAARKHRNQRRKDESASPYINHPVSVSLLLADTGGVKDPQILAAAILHDTLEDTDTTPEELENRFGHRIRKIVEEVTDDNSLPKAQRKRLQVEHAAHLSPDAVLVKLADKISNVLDVTYFPATHWSIQRRRQYLDWAEEVTGNCPKVNNALEQLFSRVVEEGRRKIPTL